MVKLNGKWAVLKQQKILIIRPFVLSLCYLLYTIDSIVIKYEKTTYFATFKQVGYFMIFTGKRLP